MENGRGRHRERERHGENNRKIRFNEKRDGERKVCRYIDTH